jgi:hypothetical protein
MMPADNDEITGISGVPRTIVSAGDIVLGLATVAWLLVTAFYCARDTDPFYGVLVGIMAPVITPFWVAVPVWASIVAIRRIWSRAYVVAALSALVPVIAVAVAHDGPFWGVVLRFDLERPRYLARIDAARAGRQDDDIVAVPNVVAFFPWSGSAVGSFGVAYDEADVIAKPLEERAVLWRRRRVPDELLCDGRVTPLGGHFYLASFAC